MKTHKTEKMEFRIKTLTPVHIGCGEDYEPTGFTVDRESKELVVLDPVEFIGGLESERRKEFLKILESATSDSLGKLYLFMSKQEARSNHRVAVSSAFVEHYKETLNKFSNSHSSDVISRFAIGRTSYGAIDGRPYIPGSSLKGAIRNAYLNDVAKRRDPRGLKGLDNGRLQNDLLDKNGIADDPFRLVSVSDFLPVGDVKTRIVYAVNKKKGIGAAGKGIPQIIEVIEEGSEFIGSIEIRQPLGAEIEAPIQKDKLLNAIREFFNHEYEREAEEIRGANIKSENLEVIQSSPLIYPLRIGRHSGAECMTVDGCRSIKINKGKGNPPDHKDHATTFWFSSDTRDTKPDTLLSPFGWCSLSELKNDDKLDLERREAKWRCDFDLRNKENLRKSTEAEAQRKEAARLRAEAEEAKQREEEDKRQNPWKERIPAIQKIDDWSQLQQDVSRPEIKPYIKANVELAQSIVDAAKRVYDKRPKKWEEGRDQQMETYLEGSSIAWSPLSPARKTEAVIAIEGEATLLEGIRGYTGWAEYQSNPVSIGSLSMTSGKALEKRFKEWGCDSTSAKPNKKQVWKDLQIRLRELGAS